MFGIPEFFGYGKTKSYLKELEALLSKRVLSLPINALELGLIETPVDFIFLMIEDRDLRQFTVLSARAMNIAENHRAEIVGIFGGLFQLAVGPRIDIADCAEKRNEIAAELIQSLGASVRVVHGRTQSRVGVIGSEDRKNWGFYPINMMLILETLLALKPGAVVDMGDMLT